VTGLTSVPADTRAHSIADGIVLVGINSLGNAVATPANSVCVNGGSKKVSIKNSSKDLLTILNTLIDTIAGTQTGICANGSPTSTIGITGQTDLAAIKVDLALLLDTGAT
jgi:hypothetical protein